MSKTFQRNETKDSFENTNISIKDKIKYIWKDSTYIFDIPAFVLSIFASVYLTFIITNYSQSLDPDRVEMSRFAGIVLNLLMVGLLFYIILTISIKKEATTFNVENFTPSDSKVTLMFISIFLVVEVVIQNYISKITLTTIEQYDQYMFYTSIAISETIIFATLFQIVWEKLTKQPIIGILIHGLSFAYYHISVYGDDPTKILVVFLSGINFAIAIKFSKRLSVPIVIHIMINIIATGLLIGGG
jgi:membrane protease YdiL (CAAX protease family)